VFETEVHEDRSVFAFGSQQVGIWIGSVVWAFITVSLPVWLSQFGPVARVVEAISVIVLAFGPAFFYGRLIQAKYPHFAGSGRWVWLLPCIFMSALLLVFMFHVHVSLGRDIWEFFSPPDDLGGVLAVLFVTYPTLGCAGYSCGIWAKSREMASE
jgi:hypothetical protein